MVNIMNKKSFEMPQEIKDFLKARREAVILEPEYDDVR